MKSKNTSQKINNDRKFIIDCYTKMLYGINEDAIAELIKSDNIYEIENQQLSMDKIIQSLSIYFQLMTLVEENAATQYRRSVESQESIFSIRGSWAEALKLWNEAGISEDEMLKTISQTHVIPVLTAHPTEAKRVTVIEIHRELYLLLVQRENTSLSKLE
jgi:phosphoenolpyruvate carboxylase